jgi:RNA polymerase sigma factor (sigma-70 family)
MELALKSTATTDLRSEQALVQAARRGDDRAFEQLYAQYRERVTAFIQSKVRDHGRAEDISQEVFMAALRQLRSNDRHIALKPWIFAIAKNACIDEFRRSSRGREVSVETDDDFPTDQRASLSVVPSPPAAIESKQRLDDLRGAFGGLSESHHRLIVMRELEGRSYDEIGNRLGMTRQMVESGLFRARRKLSEEYDELASGRRCEQVQTVIDSGAALRLKALGIKERRRLSQHLSHCQGCGQHARMAGIDETLLKPRSIAGKIAALVPFGGLWRWPWRRGGSAPARAHASGHMVASGAAQAAGSAGSSVTIGQAAAAIAALAIAGAGGGIAIAQHTHHGHHAPAAHHVTTNGAGGAGTGVSATSAGQSTAGSAGASTSRSSSQSFSATGSKTGPTPLGTGARRPGTNSLVPGRNQPTGGSGSATSSTGAPNSTSSSGGPATNPLTTTVNSPGKTLSKVTAPIKNVIDPIKKITAPITKATNPVTAPVKKVLSSPPVKSVTGPVTAPVKNVLSSPPVKSVTAPVKSVTAPVTQSTNPVTSPPPVKNVTGPVSTATNPVTSAPPVKKVGSTVGGTVQKVLPPTSTTPSGGSTSSSGSGGSQSPLPTVP